MFLVIHIPEVKLVQKVFLSKTIEYMDSRGYRVDTIKHDNNTALYFVSKSMYFYSNLNKGVTVVYRKK